MPRPWSAAVWTSPPYHHCMFSARVGLPAADAERFTRALFAMKFDDPKHRPILEAEGLREWVAPHLGGYSSLRAAAESQGFFARP